MAQCAVGPHLPHEMPPLNDVLLSLLPGTRSDFLWQAQRMPPLSRRLLLEHGDVQSVPAEALLHELGMPSDTVSLAAPVLSKAHLLSPEACATLREVVDREQSERVDTVDGAGDFQVNVSHERLAELIGVAAVETIWALPRKLQEGAVFQPNDAKAFIRRYAADTRPWNPWHVDSASVTVNVGLTSDAASCEGGVLLALHADGVRPILRGEGDATVHSSTLLHAVSRLASGVRYSLVVFFGAAERRLPAELRFDEAARAAEAAALSRLMAHPDLVAAVHATLGAGALVALRAHMNALSTSTSTPLGASIERAVQHYAAPHLKPSSILARVNDGHAAAACWSLRTLLQYMRDLVRDRAHRGRQVG